MLKFNNNHIITGEIKQLLKEFNLPQAKIWKDIWDSSKIINNALYIKGGALYKGDTSGATPSLKFLQTYAYGDAISGVTKNLIIDGNLYDSYTHEYLGDYLRFFRDAKGIDLMSMYNCFSNELCKSLTLSGSFESGTIEKPNTTAYDFDTKNDNFKIYMVPIKWFENYTIAIDCDTRIELIVGLYDDGKLITGPKSLALYKSTYLKLSSTRFSHPFLYDKLTGFEIDSGLYFQEPNLKLFIKVPKISTSSLAVMEGDYTRHAQLHFDNDSGFSTLRVGKEICNYESRTVYKDGQPVFVYDGANFDRKYLSRPQLLDFNSTVSYPFSDRLIEYIFSNVITSDDAISQNIQRIQKRLVQRYGEYVLTTEGKFVYQTNSAGDYVLTDGTIVPKNDFEALPETSPIKQRAVKIHKYIGMPTIINNPSTWSAKLRNVCYDVVMSSGISSRLGSNKFDLIGFVDKDTEREIGE